MLQLFTQVRWLTHESTYIINQVINRMILYGTQSEINNLTDVQLEVGYV